MPIALGSTLRCLTAFRRGAGNPCSLRLFHSPCNNLMLCTTYWLPRAPACDDGGGISAREIGERERRRREPSNELSSKRAAGRLLLLWEQPCTACWLPYNPVEFNIGSHWISPLRPTRASSA